MSTVTIQQIGQDLASWLAVVKQGGTVAIVDDGREIARIVPTEPKKHPAEDFLRATREERALQLASLPAMTSIPSIPSIRKTESARE